jgi:uncharacterized protein
MSAPVEGPATTASATSRILDFDVARALAILGMIVVHFALVRARDFGQPAWLARVVSYLDGWAAAAFLVSRGQASACVPGGRSRAATDRRLRVRSVLLRRGVFLLAVGFLNLAIRPGDIFRVYGISFLIAAWLFAVSDRGLWGLAIGFVMVFHVWFFAGDHGTHWD